MPLNKKNSKNGTTEKRLTGWAKLLAVVFRVLIIAGLLLLILVMIGLLFTFLRQNWLLIPPIILIMVGIIIAWLEYVLHRRIMTLKNHQSFTEDEINHID
jgi:hypothetical protein